MNCVQTQRAWTDLPAQFKSKFKYTDGSPTKNEVNSAVQKLKKINLSKRQKMRLLHWNEASEMESRMRDGSLTTFLSTHAKSQDSFITLPSPKTSPKQKLDSLNKMLSPRHRWQMELQNDFFVTNIDGKGNILNASTRLLPSREELRGGEDDGENNKLTTRDKMNRKLADKETAVSRLVTPSKLIDTGLEVLTRTMSRGSQKNSSSTISRIRTAEPRSREKTPSTEEARKKLRGDTKEETGNDGKPIVREKRQRNSINRTATPGSSEKPERRQSVKRRESTSHGIHGFGKRDRSQDENNFVNSMKNLDPNIFISNLMNQTIANDKIGDYRRQRLRSREGGGESFFGSQLTKFRKDLMKARENEYEKKEFSSTYLKELAESNEIPPISPKNKLPRSKKIIHSQKGLHKSLLSHISKNRNRSFQHSTEMSQSAKEYGFEGTVGRHKVDELKSPVLVSKKTMDKIRKLQRGYLPSDWRTEMKEKRIVEQKSAIINPDFARRGATLLDVHEDTKKELMNVERRSTLKANVGVKKGERKFELKLRNLEKLQEIDDLDDTPTKERKLRASKLTGQESPKHVIQDGGPAFVPQWEVEQLNMDLKIENKFIDWKQERKSQQTRYLLKDKLRLFGLSQTSKNLLPHVSKEWKQDEQNEQNLMESKKRGLNSLVNKLSDQRKELVQVTRDFRSYLREKRQKAQQEMNKQTGSKDGDAEEAEEMNRRECRDQEEAELLAQICDIDEEQFETIELKLRAVYYQQRNITLSEEVDLELVPEMMRRAGIYGLNQAYLEEAIEEITRYTTINGEEWLDIYAKYREFELQENGEMFMEVAGDRLEWISRNDLRNLLIQMELSPSDDVLEEAIAKACSLQKRNQNIFNVRITFSEFESILLYLKKTEGFSKKETKNFAQAFTKFDIDSSKQIDRMEFGLLLGWMGFVVSGEEIKDVMACVDTDNSLELNFKEFLKAMRYLREKFLSDLRILFEEADADGSGYCDKFEFGNFLENLGYNIDRATINDLWANFVLSKPVIEGDDRPPNEASFDDFEKLMWELRQRESLSSEHLREARISFDKFCYLPQSSNGRTSEAELKTANLAQAARWIGYNLTAEQANELVEKVDVDLSGSLDYDEYLKVISQCVVRERQIAKEVFQLCLEQESTQAILQQRLIRRLLQKKTMEEREEDDEEWDDEDMENIEVDEEEVNALVKTRVKNLMTAEVLCSCFKKDHPLCHIELKDVPEAMEQMIEQHQEENLEVPDADGRITFDMMWEIIELCRGWHVEGYRENAGFTPKEIHLLETRFKSYCRPNENYIIDVNLRRLLHFLFPNASIDQQEHSLCKMLLYECDKDNDGYINFPEFLHMMRRYYDLKSEEQIKAEESTIQNYNLSKTEVDSLRTYFLEHATVDARDPCSDCMVINLDFLKHLLLNSFDDPRGLVATETMLDDMVENNYKGDFVAFIEIMRTLGTMKDEELESKRRKSKQKD